MPYFINIYTMKFFCTATHPYSPSKSRGVPRYIILDFGAQQTGYTSPPIGPWPAMWWGWVPFGVRQPLKAMGACRRVRSGRRPSWVLLLKKQTPW